MACSNDEKWINLSTEEVLNTHIFKIYKDRTRCPRTNVEADFYRFDTGDWVNVIAVTPENKMVIIKQFRHGSQDIKLEIPGGCIDATDTDPIDAGARELLEETGFAGDAGVMIGRVQPNPALQGNYCYTVLITNAHKISAVRLEDMEDIETTLVDMPTLEKLVIEQKLDHGLVINALYFYDLYQRKNCKFEL